MLREKFFEKREYYLPDWEQRVRDAKSEIMKWKRTTVQQLFSLIILFFTVVLVYAFLLSVVNYFWFVVRETQVGLEFSRIKPSSLFFHILSVLRENTLYLSLRLCSDVVINSFLVGLALQVLPVRRYFFDPFGVINHMIWYFLFSTITALNIFGLNYSLSFDLGVILYFFPACCLLALCLKFSAKFLPEITLIFKIKRGLREIVRVARIRWQDMI